MKRFRFGLESVLTLRCEKERVAREHVLGALRARQEIEVRQARLRVRIDQCSAESRELLGRRASAAELYALQKCGSWLAELDRNLEMEKARADESVRSARQRFAAARRAREALEKYRDRKRAIHQRDGLKLEQKILDELATRAALEEPPRALQLTESL